MKKRIKFIVNKSEITAGTRGASLGPEALMTVARTQQNDMFGTHEIEFIQDENQLLDKPIKHKFAKRIDGLIAVYNRMSNTVKHVIADGDFPLVLAADHGSAGGTIAGIKATYPDKKLGVIWIDAHGDIHTPYTTPSGNMHGMPLSTALGEDNLQRRRNEVPAETVALWNEVKNCGFPGKKIEPNNLVFIGVRDVEDEEVALMNRLELKNYAVDELRDKGMERVAEEIEEKLADCDLLYVSFDVDSMDPELTSHGTGTPVPNGLKVAEASFFLRRFSRNPKLACLEIVEINPCLDEKTNRMAEVTFDLLKEIVEEIEG